MPPAVTSIGVLTLIILGGMALLLVTVGLTSYVAGWGWTRGTQKGQKPDPRDRKPFQPRPAADPARRAVQRAQPKPAATDDRSIRTPTRAER